MAETLHDPELCHKLLARLAALLHGRPLRFMEVCGTHTVAIFRGGLRSLLPESVQRLSAVYPSAVLFTTAASVLYTLRDLGLHIPVLDGVLSAVPLSAMNLGWIFPALFGGVLGIILSLLRPKP